MKVTWTGVYPAITTKFTDNDELDLPLFEKNLKFQLEAGIEGLIIGGTLGEATALTDEEKKTLIKSSLETVGHTIPVLLNIAEQTTKEAIRQAQMAEEHGAHGLMLLPPMRYKATDYETVEYFKAVANATSLPIMLYNNPVDYKILITIDMLDELKECSNIQAIKESTRDITNITRVKNKFGDRFKILGGVDTLALEALLMGADGLVAGLVCAFPEETVAIYKLAKAGRIEEALKIYRWFMPLSELDIDPQLVQNIKLAEVYTGIGSENVRAPRLKLRGKRREEVIKVIEDSLATRPTLPEYKEIEILS
ncbi:dihydrodipicolinate synthase family protein [Fulvivirga sediminis]|uniref:Dihydrodipicolinate synthase family protein n=1 Tax=Fulvivirga sediminis TaxID=2803949 RepID=A0A937F6G7_9BACT|nr:dihydrodipicolinate synthase family protein [Fulvivirga sediminis]MBL3655906.1 dihydrodipicolinate synthase family protein [Fulvivirga sediminis]